MDNFKNLVDEIRRKRESGVISVDNVIKAAEEPKPVQPPVKKTYNKKTTKRKGT